MDHFRFTDSGTDSRLYADTVFDADGSYFFDMRMEAEGSSSTLRMMEDSSGVLFFGYTGGKLYARIFSGSAFDQLSTVVAPFGAGEWGQARVVIDASANPIQTTFYTRAVGFDLDDDTEPWVQLGDVVEDASAFGGQTNFNPVKWSLVNRSGTSAGAVSQVFTSVGVSAIDETVLCNADFRDLSDAEIDAKTWVDDAGETWVINPTQTTWWYAQPGRNGAGPNRFGLIEQTGSFASGEAPSGQWAAMATEIDIRVKAKPNRVAGTIQNLIGRWKADSDRSFYFTVGGNLMSFYKTSDGDNASTGESRSSADMVVAGVADAGEEHEFRVTYSTVDDQARFYVDDVLLSEASAFTNSGIHVGDTSWCSGQIADNWALFPLDGDVSYIKVSSTIGGDPDLLDVNFGNLSARDLERGAFSDYTTGVKAALTGDEWAYVRPKTSIAGKTPELLLEAGDGNKMYPPLWADRSGNGHHAQLGSVAGADTNDPVPLRYEGEKYLWLPGVAGNYAKAEPVNLLDADTAHIQQSVGAWNQNGNGTVVAQSQAIAPLFGDYVLQVTPNGSLQPKLRLGNGVLSDGPPASQGVEVVTSASFHTPSATNFDIFIAEVDAGGAQLKNSALPDFNTSAGVWTRWEESYTPTESACASLRILFNATDADVVNPYYVDAAQHETGGIATTFVPSLRIVGDLDMRADMYLADWEPVSNQPPVGYEVASTDRRYNFFVLGANVQHFWYDTASTQLSRFVPHGLSGAGRHSLRVTNVHSGGNGTMELFVDGVSKGTSAIASTGIRSAPGEMWVGANATGQEMAADVYSVEVRDGIDGPIVAEYRPGDAFSQVDGGGLTWTVERGSSGYVSTFVDRDKWVLSTDDYFLVPDADGLDSGASEDFTVFAVVAAADDTPTGHKTAVNKGSVGGAYWMLRQYGVTGDVEFAASNGTGSDRTGREPSQPASNVLYAVAGRRSGTDGVDVFVDGVIGDIQGQTTAGDWSNANDLVIGARRNSADSAYETFWDGEIVSVALFREALTDDEIAEIGDVLLGAAQSRLLLVGVS